jgi:hypothetical protein
MSYYSIALFVHIVGALGFFVALGVEWMSVRHLRRATTAERVREWMGVAVGVRRLGMASMIALVVSGFFMMAIAQVGAAWVIVAFWALVLLAVLAVALSFRRMAAIGRAAAAETGSVSPDLYQLLHHPVLWIAIKTRVAMALGIVFLMSLKPDLSGSLLAIGIAIALGLASALPTLGRRRAQEEPSA